MYYLNARMYDPKTARFIQEDSFTGDYRDLLSLNLYTYCNNEPIMYIDPSGYGYFNATMDVDGPTTNTAENILEEIKNTENPEEKEGLADLYYEYAVSEAIHDQSARDMGLLVGEGIVDDKKNTNIVNGQGMGNLFLTDDMKKAGAKVVTIDGKQYYDYSEPINIVFWNASVEASNHKGDLKWFKSKVNHSADWDIKRKEPWEKTVGIPFPGSYDTKIIINGNMTTPEELGNMMYGYTGTAADISEIVLIAGSIYATGVWGIITNKDKRTNEFNDHDTIKKGIQWYKKVKEAKEK